MNETLGSILLTALAIAGTVFVISVLGVAVISLWRLLLV